MGLSNSTPVYDCVPSELFIQFAPIFNTFNVLMIECSDFFKEYPSKININGDIPFTSFITEVSQIFRKLKENNNNTKNENQKANEQRLIRHYEVFTYNIILCIYQYYYFKREKEQKFIYQIYEYVDKTKIMEIKENYKDSYISQEIKKLCLTFIHYLEKYRKKIESGKSLGMM